MRLRPLLPHPVVGAKAIGPVDHGAAPDRLPGDDRDLTVRGRERPSVQVEALIGGELELVEVAVVVVAAHLEHDHRLAGRRELAGDDPAPRPGPDHADVGLERLLGPGRPPDPQRALAVGRRGDRPRIADRVPGRVATGAEVGQRVEQRPGEAAQGADPGQRLRALVADAVDDLLAHVLRRRRRDPVRRQPVEQLAQARHLLVAELGLKQRHLDRLPDRRVRGRAGPEPVWIRLAVGRLEAGDEGVAECRQGEPLAVVEQLAGREQGEGVADRLAGLGGVGEVMRVARGGVTGHDHQRLALRVLADPFGAVARAEPRRLPAAHRQLERGVIRLRVVDDRRPRLDHARDPLAAFVVAGPDRGLEAVGPVVGELDRLLGVTHPHHRQGRPERLLGHAAHRVVDIREHGRLVEAARARGRARRR